MDYILLPPSFCIQSKRNAFAYRSCFVCFIDFDFDFDFRNSKMTLCVKRAKVFEPFRSNLRITPEITIVKHILKLIGETTRSEKRRREDGRLREVNKRLEQDEIEFGTGAYKELEESLKSLRGP